MSKFIVTSQIIYIPTTNITTNREVTYSSFFVSEQRIATKAGTFEHIIESLENNKDIREIKYASTLSIALAIVYPLRA